MRFATALTIVLITAFNGAVAAETQYIVEFLVTDSKGHKRNAGTLLTTGSPVEWTDGTTNAYPYINCSTAKNAVTETLASDTLFDGIKLFAHVQNGILQLAAERHLVTPSEKEIVAAFKTGECGSLRATASIQKVSDAQPARNGGEGQLQLEEGVVLSYRIQTW